MRRAARHTPKPAQLVPRTCVALAVAICACGASRRARSGRLCVTRMAAVVVAIGFTDLTFAMDSISAVLGSTTDTTLIITSQALSMLLLRYAAHRMSTRRTVRGHRTPSGTQPSGDTTVARQWGCHTRASHAQANLLHVLGGARVL